MRMIATRALKGQDLRKCLEDLVTEQSLSASVIICSVGSLSKACLRMAGAQKGKEDIRDLDGPFEIVSLIGTLQDGMHLHISLSDKEGHVIGGHMKYGCIVETTVEIVVLDDESKQFTREYDETTGFDELKIIELQK